jgi:hypothetical protein
MTRDFRNSPIEERKAKLEETLTNCSGGRLDPSDPGKTSVLLCLEESFPERLHT